MTGEDDAPRCGYETASGEPCRKWPSANGTPGRCSLPAHNEPEDVATDGGSPPDGDREPVEPQTKFHDVRDDLLAAAREGATKEGIARAAGIHRETLWEYLRDRPEFEQEFRKARWEGERQLLADADERKARFILERSYGYVKTEKREIQADVTERQAATETDDYEVITDGDRADESTDQSRFRYK